MVLFMGIALLLFGVGILFQRYKFMSGATLQLVDILHTEAVSTISRQTVGFRYEGEHVTRIVEHKHPKHAPFSVYYNPKYPKVIVKGDNAALLIGAGCIVFGAFLLFVAVAF